MPGVSTSPDALALWQHLSQSALCSRMRTILAHPRGVAACSHNCTHSAVSKCIVWELHLATATHACDLDAAAAFCQDILAGPSSVPRPQVVSRLDLTEPITQSVLIAAAAGTRREAEGVVPQADEPVVVDGERGWRLGTLLQLVDGGSADGFGGGQAAPRLLVLQQLLLKGMLHPTTELSTVKVRQPVIGPSRLLLHLHCALVQWLRLANLIAPHPRRRP